MGGSSDHAMRLVCWRSTCSCMRMLQWELLCSALIHAAVLFATFTVVACVPVQDSYYSQDIGFTHTT